MAQFLEPRAGTGPSARIMLRPVASALPFGFLVFGTGMTLVGSAELGWVPQSESGQVGLLLLSFVAPLEFAAAAGAFLARDTLGATSLGLFSGSWAATGLMLVSGPPGQLSAAFGVFLAMFTAVVLVLGVVAVRGKPMIALILLLAAARSAIAAVHEFTGASAIQVFAGGAAIAISAVAVYGGLAYLLEAVVGRPVIPVFRLGSSERAITGDLAAQLEGIEDEAGVRRQL